MTYPAMRLRVLTRLPARVEASGGISAEIDNGTLRIADDWASLADVSPSSLADYRIMGLDTTTGAYGLLDASSLPADSVPWDNVSSKPSTFPPSSHSHISGDITNFATAVDARAAIGVTATFGGSETTIASASTVDIGGAASLNVLVTGAGATITSFGTVANSYRVVRFADVNTIVHNGTSNVLPGAANITTAAGDIGVFRSDASGNWRCVDYQRASGLPVVASGGTLATLSDVDTAGVANGKVLQFDAATSKWTPSTFQIYNAPLKLINYIAPANQYNVLNGLADAAPAINAALADARAKTYGTQIVDISGQFLRINSGGFNVDRAYVEGKSSGDSIIMINFHGGNVFTSTGAGGFSTGGLKNFSFGSYPGVDVGTLISLGSTSTAAADGFEIENVANGAMGLGSQVYRFLHMDGSSRVSPSGIRKARIKHMTVFGCYGGAVFIQSTPGLWINDMAVYPGSGSVIRGSGTPGAGTGVNGDVYVDYTNRVVWGPKAAGAWTASIAIPAHVPAMPTTPVTRTYDANVYLQGTASVKSGDVNVFGTDLEGYLFVYHMIGMSFSGSKYNIYTDSTFEGSGSFINGPRSGFLSGAPGVGVTIS